MYSVLISIGEKKVGSSSAPTYVWLKDHRKDRGVTVGIRAPDFAGFEQLQIEVISLHFMTIGIRALFEEVDISS